MSFSFPRFKAIDGNGDPISGGLLYTYKEGTTTDKSAFTDIALTVAHANPIVLNSEGEALIFLSGRYKMNLTTAAGGQVPGWPIDNIGDPAEGAAAALYPDAGATDQGVTGDSNTIKYAVDTIGATNKGTIYLRHDGGGEWTDYVFSTAETIPSNITLEFEPGARLDPDNAIVVTINGPMEGNEIHQRFTGSGTVSFPTGYVTRFVPQWWGALGDNSNDDASAIQAMFTALSAGSVAYFPPVPTGYKTTTAVSVVALIDVRMDGPIIYTNTDNTTALTVGDNSSTEDWGRDHKLWVYRNTISDWTSESSIGIKIQGVNSSKINIVRASRFTIGVQFLAGNSVPIYYNNIFLGHIRDNKFGVDLNNNGSQAVNENNFYNGNIRITTSVGGDNDGKNRWGIRITSATTQINQSNKFYGTSFQLNRGGGHTSIPILLEYSGANKFYDIRHEDNDAAVVQYENSPVGNYVETSVETDNAATPSTVVDNSVPDGNDRALGNAVIGKDMPEGVTNLGKYLLPLWHSGNLLKNLTYVDGGTNVHIPGIAHYNSGTALVSTYPSWKSFAAPAAVTATYFTPPTGDAIGIILDTTVAKAFVLRKDIDATFSGRTAFIPFDSAGNVLTDNPAVRHVVNRDMPWSATNWGGSYGQSTDAIAETDVYFEVDSSTKKVAILVTSGTAVLRIRSFGIFVVSARLPMHDNYGAVYPGYSEPVPGARLIDGTVPTAGTYERGAVLFDKTATSGAASGQVCTASGTFSAATDNTGDTTNGSATIAGMADTSDFNVGDFVTVSAGFGNTSPLGESIYKILDIQTATITLDTAADGTNANVTVATPDAVFKALANLA